MPLFGAGLLCLFALQVGESLLQLIIQEDTWWEGWVGGGTRDWEAPSAVSLFLSRASHPKSSDCWYTADKGVVPHTVKQGPGFMKSLSQDASMQQ